MMPSVASTHARSSRSKGKTVAVTVTGPDAKMSTMFRDEVKTMVGGLPPIPPSSKLDIKSAAANIVVHATFERRSTSGMQESTEFCSAIDKNGRHESWVTYMSGERKFFPRIAQVTKKRFRDEDDTLAEIHEEVCAAAAAKIRDVDEDDEQVTPRKASKKRVSTSASSSSSHRKSAPAAPKKHRRPHRAHDGDADDSEFDDAATTETEASHLARTRNVASRKDGAMLGESEERSKRRCSERIGAMRAASEASAAGIKLEHDADDLASLCGRVGGLEFRSTVEPGTDVEHPIASTSRARRSDGPSL